jgi:hypothetical protein
MDKLPEEAASIPQGVASGFDERPAQDFQRGYQAGLEKAAAVVIKGAEGMSWSESASESGAGYELLKRAQAIRNLMERE